MCSLQVANSLVQAIFSNEYQEVISLATTYSVNTQDQYKQTPLHVAAHCGEKKIVELLLDKGARVNSKDDRWLTPLHRACASNAFEIVHLLVRHGADLNARDKAWQTPLHVAAANGSLECVESLLGSFEARADVTDHAGRSPLHHASFAGHIDIVKILLENLASINMVDSNNRTALHWAAAGGHEEIVDLLIQHAADVNCADKDLFTPLHVASALGHVVVVQKLIAFEADLYAVTSHGNTPLHLACLNDRDQIVKMLLKSITKYHSKESQPTSVDQSMSQNNNNNDDRNDVKSIVEAITMLSNGDSYSPIHLASIGYSGGLCLEQLLNAATISKDCDQSSVNHQFLKDLSISNDNNGCTPLHMAAMTGRFDLGKLLLKWGADVLAKDRDGNTALHLAASKGHELFVLIILENGCPWDVRNNCGSTALHQAALSGSDSCLIRLIKAACDLGQEYNDVHIIREKLKQLMEICDNQGRTLLHAACLGGSLPCLKKILLFGGNPFQSDNNGCNCLHYAVGACSNFSEQFKMTENDNLDNDISDTQHCLEQIEQILSILLKLGLDPNKTDNNGFTPLHWACAYDQSGKIVQILLEHKANLFSSVNWSFINLQSNDIQSENLSQTDVIYSNDKIDNKFNFNPIHFAVNSCNYTALQLILNEIPNELLTDYILCTNKNRIDKDNIQSDTENMPSKQSNTSTYSTPAPILLAIVHGNEPILRLLVKKCLNLSECSNQNSVTDNQLNDSNYSENIDKYISIYQLLTDPIDSKFFLHDTQFSLYHWNSLHYASSQGYTEIVDLIIDLFSEQFSMNSSVLHLMPSFENLINSVDEHGRSSLMFAAQNNHPEVIQLLLDVNKLDMSTDSTQSARLVQIDAVDVYGRTALHRAVANGHLKCIKLLAENGASFEIRDFRNRHCLHLAATNGKTDVLSYILTHLNEWNLFDNINLIDSNMLNYFHPLDEYGFSPLHFVSYKGHVECMDVLMNSRWYLNPRGNVYTPLHCAAQNGHINCLDLLLIHFSPLYITRQDHLGRTALHVAAICNQFDSVIALVESFKWNLKKCSSNVNDINSSKLTISTYHYGDICDTLIPLAEFIIQSDYLGRTALMYSASSSNSIKIFKKLLSIQMDCIKSLNDIKKTQTCSINCSNCPTLNKINQLLDNLTLCYQDHEGLTVLHHACLSSEPAIFKALETESEFSKLVSIKNKAQCTALHLAVNSGLLSAVDSLIEHGADLYAVDIDGRIPALSFTPSIQVANCVSLCLSKMFPPLIDQDKNSIDRHSSNLTNELANLNITSFENNEKFDLYKSINSPHLINHTNDYNNDSLNKLPKSQIIENSSQNSDILTSSSGCEADFF